MLHFEHRIVWRWSADALEGRSETPWNFWNVALEKDRDQLEWSCEKWSVTYNQEGIAHLSQMKWRKANTSCVGISFLNMIEGKIEMAERRCRRCKQLLDDLKYKKIFWKMKEETLDHTLWRTDFGRGHGPTWWRWSEKINLVGSCYSVSNWSIKNKRQLTWSCYRLQ